MTSEAINVDDPEKRAGRIKELTDAGLSQSEAALVDDTALFACGEAGRALMDLVDRNARLLNLSGEGRVAAKLAAMMMMSASLDATLEMIAMAQETKQ